MRSDFSLNSSSTVSVKKMGRSNRHVAEHEAQEGVGLL